MPLLCLIVTFLSNTVDAAEPPPGSTDIELNTVGIKVGPSLMKAGPLAYAAPEVSWVYAYYKRKLMMETTVLGLGIDTLGDQRSFRLTAIQYRIGYVLDEDPKRLLYANGGLGLATHITWGSIFDVSGGLEVLASAGLRKPLATTMFWRAECTLAVPVYPIYKMNDKTYWSPYFGLQLGLDWKTETSVLSVIDRKMKRWERAL